MVLTEHAKGYIDFGLLYEPSSSRNVKGGNSDIVASARMLCDGNDYLYVNNVKRGDDNQKNCACIVNKLIL